MSSYLVKKTLVGSARFFSAVLSPLLMPSYGALIVLWGSVLCLLDAGTRAAVLTMVVGITCVLPVMAIGALHHFRLIRDKRLERREDRHLPYAFAVVCYLGALFYLRHIHSPAWFVSFMGGVALTVALTLVINRWWKISAHCAGIGGVVALIYQLHVQGLSAFNLFWLLCVTILLSGVLGTSRMVLKRHDVPQVLAGFALGYGAVTLVMTLFG